LTWFYHVSQQVSTHVHGQGIVPIEMSRMTVPSAGTQMVNQETYLVGRQMIRYSTNIITTYTSCVGVSETVELASRVMADAHTCASFGSPNLP